MNTMEYGAFIIHARQRAGLSTTWVNYMQYQLIWARINDDANGALVDDPQSQLNLLVNKWERRYWRVIYPTATSYKGKANKEALALLNAT